MGRCFKDLGVRANGAKFPVEHPFHNLPLMENKILHKLVSSNGTHE
jgi:hypothetical protein